MVEQAVQMALIPAPIYQKMQSTFTLFEEGKLKGLKQRQMTCRDHSAESFGGKACP